MANQAQHLPPPQLNFQQLVENLEPLGLPVARTVQVTTIRDFCIQRLTQWTSGAFIIHGDRGSGKTRCIDAVITQLHALAALDQVAEHCTLAIVEIDLLYVVTPGGLFSAIATEMGIHIGDGDDGAFHAVRAYVSGQTQSYMMIVVADHMDRCLQDEAWIVEFGRLTGLTDVVVLTLIGTCRNADEFDMNIITEHLRILPYTEENQIVEILNDMLREADIHPPDIGPDALGACAARFIAHPDEITLFPHIRRMAIERFGNQLGEPLVHGDNMVPIPVGVMDEVLNKVQEDKAIHRNKQRSSQVLDLVMLKFANEDKWNATATEIMEEYNIICAAKQMAAKNLRQVKSMCSKLNSNGGIVWRKSAITIPQISYILDLKLIAVVEAELEILEQEAN